MQHTTYTPRPVRVGVGMALLAGLTPASVGAEPTDLAALAAAFGPRPEFAAPAPDQVKLGQLLFYDPVLSGNRNISCATCHHPRFGTSDGVSLSLGEGATGLGPQRAAGSKNRPEQRLPRNAPALFNLGAAEFISMFHDGRLEERPGGGMRTPLGAEMVDGFQSVLAAQTMFPVLSGDEMAGHYSENDIAQAVRLGMLTGPDGAWDRIAKRVAAIPAYRQAFDTILPPDTPIAFTDIANVLADFMAVEWRADNSAFDRALLEGIQLPPAPQRGLDLFYGRANCVSCHSGWLQTDHSFHAIALPQIGPGKAARFETHARDDGRLRVTGAAQDAFAFRTPSLRNVTLTAPYGHNGAFATLEAMIRHHADPGQSMGHYDRTQAVLPPLDGSDDWLALEDPQNRQAVLAASDLIPVSLTEDEIAALVAFLGALTDDSWKTKGLGVPFSVPSMLPVDR